ncbi:capsular polysaccharide synthesis protein [Prevotella marseillensis]|uniref:capsular polysaccharide synthesis protein n=1 Tax=Prevotella marseillensis TaxID=2479840 RepID=UPI000F633A0E|nr:capsular polysaccharide synthesis protein [Prevotella marseillensis]
MKNYILYLYSFGFKLFFIKTLLRICKNKRFRKEIIKIKHFYIEKWLCKEIINYDNDINNTNEVSPSNELWVFWAQGFDNAPELIKLCINSIKRNCNDWNFHLLSLSNVKEYIDLPSFIWRKLNNTSITLTEFSDILRFALLNKYGGLWIDATTFVTKQISISDTSKYWTTKLYEKEIECVSHCRWNIALMYIPKGNEYANFIYKALITYWQNQTVLIDYFLTDYFTDISLRQIETFKNELDNVEFNNINIFHLDSILNEPCNNNALEVYLKNNPYNKLQRRRNYIKYLNGKLTNYGYLVEHY